MSAPTANNGGTVESIRPEHGGELKPWKPGQSGNPTGRPKGVARVFRESTDPAQAAEAILAIAHDPKAKPLEKLAAWRELLDRGYGKAPAFAAIEGADPLEQDAVAQEIRAVMAELTSGKAA